MLEHLNAHATPPARVVLLGGSGFFGRPLAARLGEAGIETLSPSSAALNLAAPDAGAQLQALLRPTDSVVFLAALTPDRGRGIDTMMTNLRMAEQVCAALAAVKPAQVVYFSSDAVYPFGIGILDESSPAAPVDLYGAMHLSRELMLKQTVGSDLCILRPTMVHGPEDTHNSYGPNRFRRQAEKEQKIVIGGEGEETRDHIYIDDVVGLTLLVLYRRSRGLLNLATGTSVDFGTVARWVATHHPGTTVQTTPRSGPITHRAFNTTALLQAFPGYVFTSVAEGIARTFGA